MLRVAVPTSIFVPTGNDENPGGPAPAMAPSATATAVAGASVRRDSVGDLNSRAVAAGAFPGSFVIPGSRDVSLAIGGLVKTVAIADSNAEGFWRHPAAVLARHTAG